MMGSRTVQIDHMKSADTMSLQLQGHFHGIFVVHLLAVIIALGKAYTCLLYTSYSSLNSASLSDCNAAFLSHSRMRKEIL